MRELRHVVTRRPLYRISDDKTVYDAARLMTERQVSALPVVKGDILVGIVTERDLVQRVIAEDLNPATTLVTEVMTRDLVLASSTDRYAVALARMRRNHVRHLLVVEGRDLLGVVSLRDLLVVDTVEKADEIELLTSYIYAVPARLAPLEVALEDVGGSSPFAPESGNAAGPSSSAAETETAAGSASFELH